MLTEEQRDYLLPKAVNAAVRAGADILAIYEGSEDYDITIKNDHTPITVADRHAHNIIKEYLGKTHVPLLSEEGREMLYEERRGWDLFWMVDPLDGTKEFIKGNGEFTVNIALMADNVPVLAVVYVPYLSKLYFADRLTGSYLKAGVKAGGSYETDMAGLMKDAVSLPVATAMNSPLRLAISRSHNTEETYRYIDMVKVRYPDVVVVEQGSSYKFCLLAEGTVDGYIRTTNTYEWDTAAGELILEMAGGRTRSFPSFEKLEYNKLSLLNPNFVCRSKFMTEYEK